MQAIDNVVVYGLGNMGYLVAERIAKRFPVTVFDVDAEKMKKAEASFGAKAFDSQKTLPGKSIIVLSLPRPDISQAVLETLTGSLEHGSVVVETSTVNPEHVKKSQEILEPHGISIVDASVLAGVSQMEAGSATLLLGGERKAIDDSQTVLDAIAERQIYFGDAGAGAAAKVINNAVAHAVMVVVAEAGSMAKAAGVDRDKLVGLLSDAQMGLHRPLTHRYVDRIAHDHYEGGMPLGAARKDSTLALEMAQTLGVPLFAIQGSHSVYEMANSAGYGREDYAAIARLWADWGCPAA